MCREKSYLLFVVGCPLNFILSVMIDDVVITCTVANNSILICTNQKIEYIQSKILTKQIAKF